jgi:hypothetical protein
VPKVLQILANLSTANPDSIGAPVALAIMNNACKSTQHEWRAPMPTMRHHIKTEELTGESSLL